VAGALALCPASRLHARGSGYWDGVSRAMATSPYGNIAAVSCHNCYAKSAAFTAQQNLAATLDRIHAAQAAGADLRDEAGVVYVDHLDDGSTNRARLSDVLADNALKAGDQLLYLELKETVSSSSFVQCILDLLRANGYARAGRPVVLRAFDDHRQHLVNLKALLASPAYRAMEPFIKLQVLFAANQSPDIATFQSMIQGVSQAGLHGVEFVYTDRNLFTRLAYARDLGLGTNVYTIPGSDGEVYIAGLRELTDAITVDYPVEKARAVVGEANGLLFMNVADQSGAGDRVTWFRRNAVPYQAPVNRPRAPVFEALPVGQSVYGGVLELDAPASRFLTFYDADNDPGEGYLVSAAAKFDSLSVPEGQSACLLVKSDTGGFRLELYHPPGGETVLRFGVRVGDGYRYAGIPASSLNEADTFLITGAYDGSDAVSMWVNNSPADVTDAPASGGVVQDDSPIVLGAAPRGVMVRRYFFTGKVQAVQVLKWGPHP
jgi:hypothetical protein